MVSPADLGPFPLPVVRLAVRGAAAALQVAVQLEAVADDSLAAMGWEWFLGPRNLHKSEKQV